MIPGAVRAYARRMASHEQPFDDLLGDATLAIVRAGGERMNEAQRVVIGMNAIRDTMRALRYRRQVRLMPDTFDVRQIQPSAETLARGREAWGRLVARISSRARLVLEALAQGCSKGEAAARIRISPATVSRAVAEIQEAAEAVGLL